MTRAPDRAHSKPDSSSAPTHVVRNADLVIVGSGVAGLSAALEVARHPIPLRALLLTRGSIGGHGASSLAQGGVAAALAPSDSPELHARDSRAASAGLANPSLVDVLTREGPGRIRELLELGTQFDRTPSGELALGLEGAHSRRRILHAHGDRTGAEVTRALMQAVLASERIEVLEGMSAIELHTRNGRVEGVLALDPKGEVHLILASGTLLATGGAGRTYLRTTSPPGLDGDGIGMAVRAGAELMDMEFIQFHPTALNVDADPLPLVTEAIRGAGARLVDDRGRLVISAEDGGELASRDRVSRALWSVMNEGTSVFLDCRDAPGARMTHDFPGVYAMCRQHDIDPLQTPIPVTPAAHYHMGGIRVDQDGCSSVAGLWAVGEVAASGVHGANRLASNSLLEGLVFGPRAARSILRSLEDGASAPTADTYEPDLASFTGPALPAESVMRIRTLMWSKVGVVRNGTRLEEAVAELESLEAEFRSSTPVRYRNLLLAARLIALSALRRQESLGSHFRSDHPRRPTDRPPLHSVMALSSEAPHEIHWRLEASSQAPIGQESVPFG